MRRHKSGSGLAGMAGRLKPYAKRARRKASPVVEETWDHVAPAVEQARDRMVPVVEQAREKATTTLATAVTASEPYRKEAQKRGSAAWLALRGELEPAPPKRRRWVRRVLVLGGLGGAAVAAYRVLRNGAGSGWQPTPATMPPSGATGDEEPSEPIDETGPDVGKPTATTSTESVRPVVDEARETEATDASGDQAGKHTKAKPTREPATAGAKKSSSRSSSSSGSTSRSRSNAKPTDPESSS